MFIKVGKNGTIINTDQVASVRKYDDDCQIFLSDGTTMVILFRDYEYFNSIAMLPGEPNGRWCDPVVRDDTKDKTDQIGKHHAQLFLEYGGHASECSTHKQLMCDCLWPDIKEQAQSILEQE